jgi:hypothetical protein
LWFGRHQFNCDSLDIVMIVIVTRDDLRDEFIMADEAFALSPISARATQPREEDYDAISEAFMETSRGRWFLGEYAKRNRNADTRMVLDAVARIEESLAAQRQPASESGLAEALAVISSAVDEARAAATAAIDGVALEEALAPVRKGARVIREIAWRWREIGADGRICDLIDSQVSAIEAGCGQISSTDPTIALSAAFDLINERIEEFGDGDTEPVQRAEAVSSPFPSAFPAPSDEMPAAPVHAATATHNSEAAMSTSALPVETAVATDEAAEVTEAADAHNTDRHDTDRHDADAHDDAVLDMVALEMAAPDCFDTDDPSDSDADEIHVAMSPPADPESIAQRPEPPAAPIMIEPSLKPSLGSTLIANGIVRRPNAAASDPLAPIRRMSQAEKIAFFS